MRVITGTARGMRLKELPGLETRPTTDKVKESVFNIVQFDVEGRRVLDLFGGTGQMGIEALSRGAASCTLCGRAEGGRRGHPGQPGPHQARGAGEGGARGTTWPSSPAAGRNSTWCSWTRPTAPGMLEKALEAIAKIDIMTENGIIVCESAAESALPELAAPYAKGRDYRYGKIKITLYHRAV